MTTHSGTLNVVLGKHDWWIKMRIGLQFYDLRPSLNVIVMVRYLKTKGLP
jgi:hypothetical protein